MSKFYCFHCQKEVSPYHLYRWRICPHCWHKITDNGAGFYLICDRCGANMPVDAQNCPKCGAGANGNPDILPLPTLFSQNWTAWLIRAALLFFSIILTLGIIYISFYLMSIFFVIAFIYFIYNMLHNR